MSTALNPAVTPFLIYAVIALLVVFSFVASILVILGRVRAWLRTAFQEFTDSSQFETTVERILDRVAEKMTARLETRISLIEERDKERAGSVTRSHIKNDELSVQIAMTKQQLTERIDRLSDRVTDIIDRMPAKGAP